MTFFEWFYKVVIVQSVCVFLIIASVLVVKYFFKDTYKQVKDFYNDHLNSDTSVSEVIEGEN